MVVVVVVSVVAGGGLAHSCLPALCAAFHSLPCEVRGLDLRRSWAWRLGQSIELGRQVLCSMLLEVQLAGN